MVLACVRVCECGGSKSKSINNVYEAIESCFYIYFFLGDGENMVRREQRVIIISVDFVRLKEQYWSMLCSSRDRKERCLAWRLGDGGSAVIITV